MPSQTLCGQSLKLAELKALLQDQPSTAPHPLALIKVLASGGLELTCRRMHQPVSRTVLRRKANWRYSVRLLDYARGPSNERLTVRFAATWHEVLLAQTDCRDIYIAVRANVINRRTPVTPQATPQAA